MAVNQQSERKAEQDKSLIGCFNDIKNVIAVMSGKGGVGKSTVSSLLALGLKQEGYKVGILDADITGPSIPRAFGVRKQPQASEYGIEPPVTLTGIKLISVNLFLASDDDPVIWRGPLLAGAVKQFWEESDWRDLDYLIVDLPPGTGDVPLTVLQSLPVTGIVMVTSPQELVAMVVKKSIKMARALGIPILGIVENMSSARCPHCGEKIEIFGTGKTEAIAAGLGLNWLGEIPWDPELMALTDEGRIEEYRINSFRPVLEAVLEQIP